jgi:transcriptional/translational regulatory protein YebC/TACO1
MSSVLYQFSKKGLLIVRSEGKSFDETLERAVDLEVEDVQDLEDGNIKVDFVRQQRLIADLHSPRGPGGNDKRL